MTVAVSSEMNDKYTQAVQQVAAALTPDELESSIDKYLEAAAEADALLSTDALDVQRAALVAGDLKVIDYLGTLVNDSADDAVALSVGPSLQTSFALDMGRVAAGIGGAAAPPSSDDLDDVALSAATGADKVLAAIDQIKDEMQSNAAKVIKVGFVPDKAGLVEVVTTLGGQSAADLTKKVIDVAAGFFAAIKRAVAKVVDAVIHRLAEVVGSENADAVVKKFSAWLDGTIDKLDLLGNALGIPALKAEVGAQLEKVPGSVDAAIARAEQLVKDHADWQRWIGWGAAGLSVAKFANLQAAVPWGPILMFATGALLVAASVTIANDFLDGRNFPPHRVQGIRVAVGLPQ